MTAKAADVCIADLVPHAGRMVLLDDVIEWDRERIVCATTSHRAADNPLRRDGMLPGVCGCEYGAQAMAVHAGLMQFEGAGYLASLRDVRLEVARLDDVAGKLRVTARLRLLSPAGAIYQFELASAGRVLVSGQAAVLVMPEGGNDSGDGNDKTV